MPRDRKIHPVELPKGDRDTIKKLQAQGKRLTGKKPSRGEVMRRALRVAGPLILSGKVPLIEAVSVGPEKP